VIARLRGRVAAYEEGRVVVDVGGVGYLVHCSARTLGRLPPPGEPLELLIETVMREDELSLYGFLEAGERQWFRSLRAIQGVGARIALSLLSALSIEELAAAIAAQDRSRLARASGVGPRLAGRIIAELRDRLERLPAAAAAAPAGGEAVASEVEDAVSALVHLGYGRSEAYTAVVRARQRAGEEAGVDRLVREALRELAS